LNEDFHFFDSDFERGGLSFGDERVKRNRKIYKRKFS